MPLLVIQSEKHSAAFKLTETTVIGRLPETDLVLQAQGVSREHTRVVVQGADCIIEDLESTNGTWVNGKRLTKPYKLREGDEIRIGLMRLCFLTRNDVPREMKELRRNVPQGKHIVFRCPTCHGVLQAPRQYVGRKGKCENCNTRFIVPDASGAAVQAVGGETRKPAAPVAASSTQPAHAPKTSQKPALPIPADEPVTTTAAGLEPAVIDAVTPAQTVETTTDGADSRDLAEAPAVVEADRTDARTVLDVPAAVEPAVDRSGNRSAAEQAALIDPAADRADNRGAVDVTPANEPAADRSDSRGQVDAPAAVEAAADRTDSRDVAESSLDTDAANDRADSSRDLDAAAAFDASADRSDSHDFIDADRVSSAPDDAADFHDNIIGFELESNEEHEADCCDKLDDNNAVLPAAVAADRGEQDRAAERPTLVDPAAACIDESRDHHAAPAAPATFAQSVFDADQTVVDTTQPRSDVTDDALHVKFWLDDRGGDLAMPAAEAPADHPAPADPSDRPFADVSHDATDDTIFYAHASLDVSDALRSRTPQRHADPVDAPQGAADDRTFRDDSAAPSLVIDDVHLAGLAVDTAGDRLTVSDLPEGDRGLIDAAHGGDEEHPSGYFQEMSAAPTALQQLPAGPASQEERSEIEAGLVDEPDWWQNAMVVVEKEEPQAVDTPPAVAVRLAQPARQDRQQIGWVARVRKHVAQRNQQIQQQVQQAPLQAQPVVQTPAVATPADEVVAEPVVEAVAETVVERQPLPQSVVLARFLSLVAGMKGASNLIVEAKPNTVESGVPYETQSGRPGSAVVREAIAAEVPQATDLSEQAHIVPTEEQPVDAADAAGAPAPADVLPLVDAALNVLVDADQIAASHSHQPDAVETTLTHAPEAAQDAAEEARPSSESPATASPIIESNTAGIGAVAAAEDRTSSSDVVVDSTLDAALPADEARDLPTDIAAARVAADEPARSEQASVPAVEADDVAPAAQDAVTEQIIDAATPAVPVDAAPVVDVTEPAPAPAAAAETAPQNAEAADDNVVDNAHLIDWFPEEADMIATRKNSNEAVDNSHLIEWFPEPVVSGASSAPANPDEDNSHLIEWLPAETEQQAGTPHVHDQNCSVCSTSMADEDEKMVCPECGTTYHAGCWHENHGCASYGCAQVNVLLEGKQPPPTLPGQEAAEPRQAGPRRRLRVQNQPVNDGVSWEVVFSLAACAACIVGLATFGVPNLLVTLSALAYKAKRRRRPFSSVVFTFVTVFTLLAAGAGAVASMYFYGFW